MSAAVTAPVSKQARTGEPDLASLQASIGETHDWRPGRVEGRLPAELRGTLIRTGPGLLERFGRRLSHSFEADGVLIGLQLPGDGSARVAARVVESPGYLEEQAAGRPLFGSAAPRWRRILNALRGRTKSTGNTSIMRWQDRTFALMEGGRPIEIDPATLGTGAVSTLGGAIGGTFSAHPHTLPADGVTWNFGQVWGPSPALDLYTLPPRGQARRMGRVAIPWNTMVHDFAITDGYLVFVICPARLRLPKVLLGSPEFDRYFEWRGSDPAQLVVVPMDDLEHPLRIDLPARWVFHVTNAFRQDDDTLAVDWVQYPGFEVFTALSGHDPDTEVERSRVQRVRIDLRKRRLVEEHPLWDRHCDFPVLPARRVGRRYRTAWYTALDLGPGGGIARHDADTGDIDAWMPGHGHSMSEAVLVPRPGARAEDDAWLLALVCDGWERESYVAVLDARHPSRGPIARVWMGQPLPMTFHGAFLPSR